MLKNIPSIISPELLKCLCELGHGDEFTIADGNFPCYGVNENVVRADGHGTIEILNAISQLIPLDSYAEWNIGLMKPVEGDSHPEITDKYIDLWKKVEGDNVKVKYIERFDFYEQAKKSRFVLATSEGALYANIIIKKGVIK